jgi:hypothetical protein
MAPRTVGHIVNRPRQPPDERGRPELTVFRSEAFSKHCNVDLRELEIRLFSNQRYCHGVLYEVPRSCVLLRRCRHSSDWSTARLLKRSQSFKARRTDECGVPISKYYFSSEPTNSPRNMLRYGGSSMMTHVNYKLQGRRKKKT